MEIDYLPLRDEPTPLQAVSRGAVRLLSLALGGLACAQWARTHFFWNRTSQPESSQPFMPHSGVRSVSVKPGYPGLMQAASWLSAPSCLFFYNNRLVDDEFGEDASRAQPARMYGAKLFRIQETGALPFAVPTGNPSDSVEGRLLCWTSRQFRAKLKKADQLLQYPTHAKDKARGEWRRHVLTVVREDGSEANAWWYYKDAVPVGKFTVEPHDQNSWGTLAAVGKLLGNMKATADREMQEMTQNVLAGPVASLARQVYKTDGEVQDGINALLFLVVDTTLSILQKDDLRGELSVCATVLQFRAGVTCTTEKTDGYSLTRILQEQEERLIKKGNENSFGSKILHGLIRATGGEVGHKTNSTTEEEVTKAVEVALSTLLSRLYRLANGMKERNLAGSVKSFVSFNLVGMIGIDMELIFPRDHILEHFADIIEMREGTDAPEEKTETTAPEKKKEEKETQEKKDPPEPSQTITSQLTASDNRKTASLL